MAADLHGWLPLAILTRQVFVITLQHVAFGTQVLDDAARVQGVSTGPGVADVATILWLRGQGTHCKDRESRGTVVRFSSQTAASDREGQLRGLRQETHQEQRASPLERLLAKLCKFRLPMTEGGALATGEAWLLAALPLALPPQHCALGQRHPSLNSRLQQSWTYRDLAHVGFFSAFYFFMITNCVFFFFFFNYQSIPPPATLPPW